MSTLLTYVCNDGELTTGVLHANDLFATYHNNEYEDTIFLCVHRLFIAILLAILALPQTRLSLANCAAVIESRIYLAQLCTRT